MQNIAVVIVTWNAAHLLEQALAALQRQTLQANRIIIVDNGSADSQSLQEVTRRFAGCELLLLRENKGFAAANNIGIQHCPNADFIALLNPDAFPEPDWLAELLDAAERHPDTAAFASRLLSYREPHRLDGAGDYLTIAGKPGRRGHGALERGAFLNNCVIFSPCAAAALYRAGPLRAIGGFDESFFCYVEDTDLAFRLLLAGYRSRYVPTAVARHIGSALTGRRSDFSIYYGQRNLVFNYVKNMPAVLFWSFLLPHVVLNFIYLLAAACIGRGKAVWRAKRDAVAALPALWQQRRKVQQARRASSLTVLKSLRISLW